MRKLILAGAAVSALVAASETGQATLLFDDGTGNFTSFRSPANPPDGAGQGIAVSTNTNLTNIGVDIAMPTGGNVKFLIFNAANSALLLATSPETLPASTTPAYVESPSFSFTLNAGTTYFFGVIADNNIDINFYFPPQTFDQNGLDALLTGNSNYDNFASPMLATANPFGGAEMTLQLFGTQAASAPEPASIGILGVGLLGLGLLRRYRRR